MDPTQQNLSARFVNQDTYSSSSSSTLKRKREENEAMDGEERELLSHFRNWRQTHYPNGDERHTVDLFAEFSASLFFQTSQNEDSSDWKQRQEITDWVNDVRFYSLDGFNWPALYMMNQLDLGYTDHIDNDRKPEGTKTIPESFGLLTNLVRLDISGNHNIKFLPKSIENLTKLKTLDLSCCENLDYEDAIDKIKNVKSLKKLFLSGLEATNSGRPTFPQNIGLLTQIKVLVIDDVPVLDLPKSIANLKGLEKLVGGYWSSDRSSKYELSDQTEQARETVGNEFFEKHLHLKAICEEYGFGIDKIGKESVDVYLKSPFTISGRQIFTLAKDKTPDAIEQQLIAISRQLVMSNRSEDAQFSRFSPDASNNQAGQRAQSI